MKALLILLVLTSVAYAGKREELAEACTGDAMHLCSWSDLRKAAIGNFEGVSVCFHIQHSKLSDSCKTTMLKYGYR